MTLLSVRDLAVSRGGMRVIEGLSFSLDRGQALVLRGPNGAGKTTLLRTLAGLQRPVSGAIDCDLEATAYAGHADGVKPALTASENLGFWAEVFGGAGIEAALDAMNLTELADRPAHRLSAGQKRRLGLARMMVAGRGIWLLDEPTVSLDTASTGLFTAMLQNHLRQGGAALIATHIDLGLQEASILDLAPYRAGSGSPSRRPAGFDEAFA